MHLLRRTLITALVSVGLLLAQSPAAHALYSPTLSRDAALVRQHILKARQRNGVGSFTVAYERVKEGVTANKGLFNFFGDSVAAITVQSLTDSFADGFSLLINYWIDNGKFISNCLRDDIWEIQALQEETLNELFKAALLSDYENADLLWKDYRLLKQHVDGDGNDQVASLKKNYEDAFWFPEGANYYAECPYDDFSQAFNQVKNSFDRLISTFSVSNGALGSFASIAKNAELRAVRRAAAWVAANQLKLTLGGTTGGNPRSLFNGPGLKGLEADLKTELEYAKSYSELVYRNLWNSFKKPAGESVPVSSLIQADQIARAEADRALNEMETAIAFNLSLNNVAENSLKGVEQTLFEINKEIQKSFEQTSGKGLCEQLNFIAKNQCKQPDVKLPDCST